MLLKNTASQTIPVGSLIKTSDGSRLTTGATIRWYADGTWADGAGTLTVDETDQWKYSPTQAETNCNQWAISIDHASAVQPIVITGRTMYAAVGLASEGTGTGQILLDNGLVKSNLMKIYESEEAAEKLKLERISE